MTTILGGIYDFVFGCKHARYTFPQTVRRNGVTETTVSCLDCGKTMPYDFDNLGSEEAIVGPRKTAPKVYHIETPEQAKAFAARS
jgi:hypothetical protein